MDFTDKEKEELVKAEELRREEMDKLMGTVKKENK